MSGIQHRCVVVFLGILLHEVGSDFVAVEGQHGTALHSFALAAASLEPASYETTLVLGPITFFLGKIRIFFDGFRRANSGRQTVVQSRKCDGLVRPDLGEAAAAVGDFQFTHPFSSSFFSAYASRRAWSF